MRIALLFEYPTLNGGERSILQGLRHASAGYDFVALAPETGRLADALDALGIDRVSFDLRGELASGSREARCAELAAKIERLAPDLVHANSLAMGRLTGAAADRLPVPCTAHLRDIVKLSSNAVGELNHNRRLIAVSRATRDFHVAQGVDTARIDVIYNGIDADRFGPRPVTGALRQELRLPESSFVLLTVGQIGLRKGQDVLAAAAPEIVAGVPNAQFVIVGERNSTKAESISFERELSADFERAGLGNRLHLIGYREDVPQLLNEADLLVHPAKQEPLGRVLLEAAASELPIVATAVGGTTEILTDGVSAQLFPPSDPCSLARATVDIALDSARRAEFAAAARAHVLSAFDVRAAANKLSQAWNEVLAGSRTSEAHGRR